LDLSSDRFPRTLSTNILYAFIVSCVRSTCTTSRSLQVPGYLYTSRSFSLRSTFHFPPTACLSSVCPSDKFMWCTMKWWRLLLFQFPLLIIHNLSTSQVRTATTLLMLKSTASNYQEGNAMVIFWVDASTFSPEDRNSVFFRNVGTHPQVHTMSQPRRLTITVRTSDFIQGDAICNVILFMLYQKIRLIKGNNTDVLIYPGDGPAGTTHTVRTRNTVSTLSIKYSVIFQELNQNWSLF
jgi:hypothetical protein